MLCRILEFTTHRVEAHDFMEVSYHDKRFSDTKRQVPLYGYVTAEWYCISCLFRSCDGAPVSRRDEIDIIV